MPVLTIKAGKRNDVPWFPGYVIERTAPAWLSLFGMHALGNPGGSLKISQGETHMERNWSLPSQRTATTARVNESSDDSSSQF